MIFFDKVQRLIDDLAYLFELLSAEIELKSKGFPACS